MNSDSDLVAPLRGARPSKQARSRDRQAALLVAGLKLLRTQSFSSMTIERIASEAQCAVGTFYARFEDKDAFLIALQEHLFRQQIAEAQDVLAPEKWLAASLEDVITGALEFVVNSFRGDAEGLLRAALIHSAAKPDVWSPAKETGRELVNLVCALLVPRLNTPKAEENIRAAMQLLYGTLINMILHEPGPLDLNSRSSRTRLVAMISELIQSSGRS